MPNAPVARTISAAAPGWKHSSEPTGASITGHAQLAAEPLDRRVDPADVGQNARSERDRVERHAVAPQRRLGLGGADDVVPVVLG